jgi:hypothetical protein
MSALGRLLEWLIGKIYYLPWGDFAIGIAALTALSFLGTPRNVSGAVAAAIFATLRPEQQRRRVLIRGVLFFMLVAMAAIFGGF